MIYPNRKKLTEYPIVTPTLADSVVNIQGNTVKRSTLQSILNLFSANTPDASTSVKGVAQLATQAEAELSASGTIGSIDNTKIITPTGWRYAWNKALTLAWTFISKISFTSGINLASSSTITTNGDILYTSNKFYAKVNGANVYMISSSDISSQSSQGVIALASESDMEAGTNDNVAITPAKLQYRTLNVANNMIGSYFVTLNTVNGIITYTTGAGGGTVSYYTMTNSKINSTSYVIASIKVNSAEPAVLLLGGYSISGTQITFYVYNASLTTSGSFKIYFQILNS